MSVALWDGIVASLLFLTLIPALAALVSPLFVLAYVIDLPAVAVPVLWAAFSRREVGRALASLPCFPVLRVVNSWFLLRAAWTELVLRRSFSVYLKGH